MSSPGLFDGSFAHAMSATYGGDNLGKGPKHFTWQRGQEGQYVTFYTDMCLDMVKDHKGPGLKVAWLLEPPSLSDMHYRKAVELEDRFDYIFTFKTSLLNRGKKWLYYPLGGSWVDDRSWIVKDKLVSVIGTEKQGAEGHRMRHSVIQWFEEVVDVWGRGYKPMESKVIALGSYRYSIVIESIRMDDYFSEKLIDCLNLGTIPIYWGSPSINDSFHSAGIIPFDTVWDLKRILGEIGPEDYRIRFEAVQENRRRAEQYVCSEDWIYNHYFPLFGVSP
jgi:hypothetical protein